MENRVSSIISVRHKIMLNMMQAEMQVEDVLQTKGREKYRPTLELMIELLRHVVDEAKVELKKDFPTFDEVRYYIEKKYASVPDPNTEPDKAPKESVENDEDLTETRHENV